MRGGGRDYGSAELLDALAQLLQQPLDVDGVRSSPISSISSMPVAAAYRLGTAGMPALKAAGLAKLSCSPPIEAAPPVMGAMRSIEPEQPAASPPPSSLLPALGRSLPPARAVSPRGCGRGVAVLDEYVQTSGLRSRSAALQHAIRLLRHPKLEQDYVVAWDEWESPGEQSVWKWTAADGLAIAAR